MCPGTFETYKGCNSRFISNLLTGDETWVHMFEPQRRADNKQWKGKDKKRTCIAKRKSSKKMLYAIFFNSSGPVPSSALSIWSYSHWRILQEFCTEESESFSIRNDQADDGQESTFYMTAPPLMCEVVKSFLASEKVKNLNHPPYSPDLSPCDFFVLPRLKKMLSGNKYTSRSSLGSSIYQCLQQIPKKDYLSAFRDWVKRLQKMCFSKGGIL